MPRDPIGDLRKLRMLEVLREVSWGGRNLKWFDGRAEPRDERRADATGELLRITFVEKVEGYPGSEKHPFRLTDQGHSFLQDAAAAIGAAGVGCAIDIAYGVRELRRTVERLLQVPLSQLILRGEGRAHGQWQVVRGGEGLSIISSG